MRLLLAGRFQYPWYEEACARALEQLGHEVYRFPWVGLFQGLLGRIEDAWIVPGLATARLNRKLLATAARVRPDVILVWRGTHVLPSTLRVLRAQAYLVSYNNDDAFSPAYTHARRLHMRRLWRLFRPGIPEYDLNLVYRQVNLEDYRRAGARAVRLLMPYFVPELHRPLALDEEDRRRFEADVVFVGHWEPDGRADCLRALNERGFRLRVFGAGWQSATLRTISSDWDRVQPVFDDEYAKALSGARLCLSFLSKINRDTYTRRSFEIPACGRAMVSERSEDLQTLFREDAEAVLFSSAAELVAKASALLADPTRREAIARAGRRRCLRDGHDVVSRMRELVTAIEATRGASIEPGGVGVGASGPNR